MNISTILLDIEGTTTPIDFVHQTLFPYARARIGDYVRENLAQLPEVVEQLKAERAGDSEYQGKLDPASPDSITGYLHFLIDVDRKSTPLKLLQGEIWQAGYEAGELRSRVFDDVPPAFERWTGEDKRIAIYSSGSVLAQKMLFRYTDHGDLTPFLSAYFDTKVGPKRDSLSYARISNELKTPPENTLFISDVVEELDAAKRCGLHTLLSVRPGNQPLKRSGDHREISTFDEVP